MADELPTWDQALATASSGDTRPTWDEAVRRNEQLDQLSQTLGGVGTGGAQAYSSVNSGSAADAFFTSGPAAHILNAFGQGAAQDWGAITSGGLSPETEDYLKKNGFYSDYDRDRRSTVKTFNEALFRGLGMVYHGVNALFGGTHEALIAAAEEGGPILGAPFGAAVAGMEAFPFGRVTGLPARIPRALVEANDLKVIGAGGDRAWRGLPTPAEAARESLRPPVAEPPAPAAEITPPGEVTLPEVVVTPSDRTPEIHARAREIAPDIFREYDALDAQRETFRQHLEDLRSGSEVRDLEEQIQTLQGQSLELPPNQRGPLQAQVAELEKQRMALADQLAKGDTPQARLVQGALQKTDEQMRDLAPEVSAAYRRAAAEPPSPAAEVAPPTPEPTPTPEVATPAAEPIEPPPAAPSIAADVSRKLVDAGRPVDEANATAALVQAIYETRAARFGGNLGTAEELYTNRFPTIALEAYGPTVRGRTAQGALELSEKTGKPILKLFGDANASTAIHELGHNWLEELQFDARNPQAPASLKDDMATVRNWLGVEPEGQYPSPIPTRAHEKFARGFERYMMEGIAPSRALAGVFAKFRDWLTTIYQTVARLRAPITDDIRAVFDRMLAEQPEKVIAPERIPPRGLGEVHAEEVAATHPAVAPEVADQLRGERDEVAGTSRAPAAAELNAERNAARGAAAQAGGDTARGGIPDRGGYAGQPYPTGPGAGAGVGEVGAGGAAAAPEGAGVLQPAGAAARGGRPRPAAAPTNANGGFAPSESAHIDRAGNIRLDTLGTPEDVNAVIREAAARGNEFVAARRGVIPDSEISSLADALGMTAKSLDKRRLGEAFNAEQVVAARKLLIQSAINVRDLAGRVEDGTNADLMAYAEARARHMMIQEQVAGITAEAGRALRAFRTMTGSEEAGAIARFLGEKLTGRTLNQLREEARTLSQQGNLQTPQQVSKVIAAAAKPTWKDMVIEVWINGLLSGTATHITNMVGNTSVIASHLLETTGAAAIGGVRQAVLGSRAAERVSFGEVGDRVFGLVKGSQEGVIAAGKALLDENYVSPFSSGYRLERRTPAIPKGPSLAVNVAGIPVRVGPGDLVRLPGRFLTAEDEIFKGIAFRQELNVQARRQARDEGLRGTALDARIADLIENPPDELVEASKKGAAYQTFTQPLGPVGSLAQIAINKSVVGKLIVPFLRTPVNLVKYAAERTPFGLLSREVRDNLMGRNGAVARDTQYARLALGSAIMTSVAALAAGEMPVITGAQPTDPKKLAAWRQMGLQPYAVKIGNHYVSYAWLDPWATVIGTTADLVQAAQHGLADDADVAKVAEMLVTSTGQNVLSKLSLRGMADFIHAATDAERYGERWVAQTLGSIIPSQVAAIARTQDPVMRDARGIVDTWKSRIPGLRETLHPRIDAWGQPVPNQGTVGPDILSRAYETKVSNDPVNKELFRLGSMPAPLDRKIRGVTLSDSQYEDYARTAGRMAKIQLDKLINNPRFPQWDDFHKRFAIKQLIDDTREQADALMLKRYPTIWQTAVRAKKEEIHGATPEHGKALRRNQPEAASP